MSLIEMDAVFSPVPAPVTTPYRFGLFSVATPTPDSDTDWEGFGITWRSDSTVVPRVTFDPCIVDNVDPLVADEACTWPTFDPFTVYHQLTGSLKNRAENEAAAKARLLEVEQFGVERQLWTALAADVTEVAQTNLLRGLALVEQMLVEAYPALGVVHMSRYAATMLGDVLVREGSRLTTPTGTPVVAGGGYGAVAGVSPTTVAIYGTGPIVMRRGQVVDQSVPHPDTNALVAMSYRSYVVGWDGDAIGVTVTL